MSKLYTPNKERSSQQTQHHADDHHAEDHHADDSHLTIHVEQIISIAEKIVHTPNAIIRIALNSAIGR